MFGKMSGQRLATHSSAGIPLPEIVRDGVRGAPDVSALASRDKRKLCIMLWHYHDDDVTGPDADVALTVRGLPVFGGTAQLRHFRIDETHSNAFTVWKRLGSPQAPTSEEYAALEKAGQLEQIEAPAQVRTENGQAALHFTLPRQAVSLLTIDL